ncbi:type II secretion system F family protein [Aeoliella sp. ICT_H6.2]|uniref:Type II secretion system F family protein n=1 Tax=Aeoliella straminimaris TaxID=2954799 RepID=A0A9X2FDF5_9BACT|nr:type II secretion system F family protein [Aeoliella straminimaris]MCO6047027.1 type II secretion system F family protein [Aeoliella straminimaris]
MPTFQFEAMDATGAEIKDVIEATTEEEAQATIRQMGYFVTKISVKKSRKKEETGTAAKKKRGLVIGGVKSKDLTTFTRQLSILQDAGLPILRSLRILATQAKPGRLKYSLEDTCDEIEAGATLSEAMAKSPKCFNRLYVNMIKAGEAGGALELILQRLADFQERAESLKRKVKGAMIYPVFVVGIAVIILTLIMIFIVPQFRQIFTEFDLELPPMTEALVSLSDWTVSYWYLIPLIPTSVWLFIKLVRKFKEGRMGWDQYIIKVPIFGQLFEKNTMARTARTLGTLVASGVPILEALNITRDTSGNAVFERMYSRISEAIREGESIAKPMKEHSMPGFHPVALFFWITSIPVIGGLLYLLKYNQRIVDDIVVNMVDVGEETGELDTMLYKVADVYDEEVAVLTDSLTKLMEPILIIVLGGMVGFIVVALFIPLVKLIEGLSG